MDDLFDQFLRENQRFARSFPTPAGIFEAGELREWDHGECRCGAGSTAPKLTLAASIQANLGRVSKFADGKTRNWTLYTFFRILPSASFAVRAKLFADFLSVLQSGDQAQIATAWSAFLNPVEVPASIGAGPLTPDLVAVERESRVASVSVVAESHHSRPCPT